MQTSANMNNTEITNKSKLQVCRGCLDNNVEMRSVSDPKYQELYEKLSNSQLTDGLPETFCYICYSLLRKCMSFSNMVQQSHLILAKLHQDGVEITESTLPYKERPKSHLSTTEVKHYSFSNKVTSSSELIMNIKSEELADDECNDDYIEDFQAVKDEDELDILKQDGETMNYQNIGLVSDSLHRRIELHEQNAHTQDLIQKLSYNLSSDDDNEPLAHWREGKQKRKRLKELNVTPVFINYQEQKNQMLNRSESDNYKLSKYKCNLCFRGYINMETYTKHLLKHDERSGEYECDLCHFRYKNLYLLRKHIDDAHARFFKCKTCGILVHTSHQAKDHNKEHKGILYPCKLCGKQFKKRTTYLSHTRIHHANSEYICKMCGCNFVNQLGLKLHQGMAHKNEDETKEGFKSKCVQCDIEFLNLKALHRHRLISDKHKELHCKTSKLCYVCEKILPNAMNLNKHIISHRKELLNQNNGSIRKAMFSCKQCPVKVSSNSNLLRHIQNCHSNETSLTKSFICEVCGAKRNSNAALCAHQRLHTGEKPFKCPSCTKTFTDNNKLKLHYRVHTGEKPFTCDRCSKQFSQKTALNRHMRVHTGVKPFGCHLCSKSFSQSNSLKTHINSVHLKLPSYRQKKKEILLKNNKINLDFPNL